MDSVSPFTSKSFSVELGLPLKRVKDSRTSKLQKMSSIHLPSSWTLNSLSLCFTVQLPAFWFTKEFFLLSYHTLALLCLRQSFSILFSSPQPLEDQCSVTDEGVSRKIYHTLSVFPWIFSSHLGKGLHASKSLSPFVLCLYPLVYYSHVIIEFPW